jgi:type IV pilus assembly protein PilF
VKGYRLYVIAALAVFLLAGCYQSSRVVKKADANQRAELRARLAASYMQRNRLVVAQQEIDAALDIEPDNAYVNYVMARLQLRLKKHDQAEKYYRRAIRSKKNYMVARHEYGVFLCHERRHKEGIQQFEMVLQDSLYQDKALVNMHMGDCLLDKAPPDYAAAETLFRAALERDPTLSRALLQMARIQFEGGKFLSARAYIERYFERGRDTAAALYLAVRIERSLKADAAAKRYAIRLKRKFPKSPEARQLNKLL